MKSKLLIGFLFLFAVVLLFSCSEKKEPLETSTHPEGWSMESSADFHGAVLASQSMSLQSCQSCHGENYMGGTSNVSCYSSGCHTNYPHPAGFENPATLNSHDEYLVETNWDLIQCQSCHGANYDGMGVSEKSCLSCHTAPNGPEACNTCHGSSDNPAPPEDLRGNTNTTSQTVGAHQEHLVGTTWSTYKQGECSKCHVTPDNYDAPAHVLFDDTPHAEVPFGGLATMNGELNTSYDRLNAKCDNVYCHGAFEFKKSDSDYPWAYADSVITGNNPTLYWKYVGTGQALCGSCHGLPPRGHVAANTCGGCHGDVVDDNFNITNKFLHINGKIEVF